MKTSASGRALIEVFEGLRLDAYKDAVGVWTIGYGHTSAAGGLKVRPGMKITEAEADKLLAGDLKRVEKHVERIIRVPLTQNEFDALVSFDFNTGSLMKGSIDNKINAGDKIGAMKTLLRYNHGTINGKSTVLRGLTRRRKAEKLMFEGNVKAALKLAGVKKVVVEQEKPKQNIWHKVEAKVAEQIPGAKTKAVASIGMFGSFAAALQSYLTGIPLDQVVSPKAALLIGVALFALVFWLRRIGDRVEKRKNVS